MMLSLRVFAYVGVILSLQGAAVAQQQAASTDLPSTNTEVQNTAHATQSPTTTVTKTVVITSTASRTTTPPGEFTTPVPTTFLFTVVHSGHTSIVTATDTLNPALMTTVPHQIHTPIPGTTQPADGRDSSNSGAIAGGVLGALAVIVAALAAFVWFRRRSHKHWRNRTAGRWQSFDNKDVGSAGAHSVYVGEPVFRARGDIKQLDPDPLPALYLRDRQPAANQFGDVPGSPTSRHSRVGSGSYSGRDHHRMESSSSRFDIELQPTLSPAK